MSDDYNYIEEFLKDPEGCLDSFWDCEAVMWVDWRSEDDYILDLFNERLAEEDQMVYEVSDGYDDIFIIRDGKKNRIPYKDTGWERDVTIRAAAECVQPKYQLRHFTGSAGTDGGAFCIIPTEEWQQLEERFGEEYTAKYFAPVKPDSVIFGC